MAVGERDRHLVERRESELRRVKEPGFPVTSPIAKRSTILPGSISGEGGRWEYCGPPTFQSQLETLRLMVRDSREFKVLRQQLHRLMARAEIGKLTYGKSDDVVEIRREPSVLELRLTTTVQFPNEKRKVRLYFSEPDLLDGVLLASKIAGKPATEAGLDLQDEHTEYAFEMMKVFLVT